LNARRKTLQRLVVQIGHIEQTQHTASADPSKARLIKSPSIRPRHPLRQEAAQSETLSDFGVKLVKLSLVHHSLQHRDYRRMRQFPLTLS